MGTKETIEAIDFLFDIADAVMASTKDDGKITIVDAPKFLKLAIGAPKGIGGIQDVPKEITDLSEAEMTEIVDHIKDRFDLTDDGLETAIEDILKSSGLLALSIQKIYQLKK